MKPTLLIMAAGMGSRYAGLKQIDPVGPNNEFLMDYAIYDAIKAGFGKIVFIITKKIENEFKEKIGYRYQNQIEIDYVFQKLDDLPVGFTIPEEREKPWGTGQAILAAREVIREPFAVINADDFYGPFSYKIMADSLKEMPLDSKEWCMTGFQLKNTLSKFGQVSRGVCTSVNGLLSSVVERDKIEKLNGAIYYSGQNQEKRGVPEDSIVSMNMWGFAPDSLFSILESEFTTFLENNISKEKAEFYIPFVVDSSIKNKWITVKILKTTETWFGMTFPQDKEIVRNEILEMIKKGIYPENLFE